MQGTGAYLRHAMMEGENVSDQSSGPKHLMFKYNQKWVTTHLGPVYTLSGAATSVSECFKDVHK